MSGNEWGDEATPYEAIGGEAGVASLVGAFYDRIELESPHIRAMLPKDTTTSRRKLFEFLCGWLGGPPLYIERHGHPRLRMRHARFAIGTAEAQEWMRCMRLAMGDTSVPEPLRSFLDGRLTMSAMHVRNTDD